MSTAAADARVGTVFHSRYSITRKIGSGGTSTVYLAKDAKGGRQVALKVLDRSVENDTASKRFLREIEVMRRLQHPNIVEVYEAGETAMGELYISMEVLKGRTLAKQLRQHGPMEAERAITIARQIVLALGAAHSQKILHRDLKPSNIRLVSKEGSRDFVKVLDFAIARFVEDDEHAQEEQLTAVGKVVGTPAYMAPEQIASKPLDGRCDLYAVGCLLYEMVTGRTPFVGRTFEIMRQHAFDRPPNPSAVTDRKIPSELQTLILKMLEKDPEDRPADAEAIAEILTQIDMNVSASNSQSFDPGLSFDGLGDRDDDTYIPDNAGSTGLEDDDPPTTSGGMAPASMALAGFGTVFFIGAAGLVMVFVMALAFMG